MSEKNGSTKSQGLYKIFSSANGGESRENGERDHNKSQGLYKMVPLNKWWRIQVDCERDQTGF